MSTTSQELDTFLEGWNVDPINAKTAFLAYRDFLASVPGVSFTFKSRPGVSYSLRARHEKQRGRELFVLLDVVDDEPESRWLSVCFYDAMITDPLELGDFVPRGLMGEDARCFNLDEEDDAMRAYIADRLRESASRAAV